MIKKEQTNKEYHLDPSISASGLKTIYLKSVFHHINRIFTSTPAMIMGSAVHSYFLEPENFKKEFFVMPKLDLRTKMGKEKKAIFEKENKGKDLVTEGDFFRIKEIEKNYLNNESALYYSEGEIEVSHFSNYKGIPIKARPDCYNIENNFISDIKTCQDNSPKSFKYDVYKWGYHLQAVVYSEVMGIPVENFRFIAIETKYPYSVQVYSLNEKMIEDGKFGFQKALSDWKFYLETGIIMGYNRENLNQDGSIIL
tara:strand:- start:4160 stop:4921 length:762 start_codon:yes stop_codon:yes gene_type:complete